MNSKVFRPVKPGESLDGYERLPYHVVWDCKFDYQRKAGVVLQDNKQIAPADDAYSGMVSLTSV